MALLRRPLTPEHPRLGAREGTTLSPDLSTVRTCDPKRIAIFLPSLHGGGAERVLLHLACEFVLVGHQVDLVLMNAYPSPLMALIPEGVRTVDLSCPRLWTSGPAMARYIQNTRPNGILAAMPLANAIACYARAATRVPLRLVISEHNAKSIAFGDVETLRDAILSPLIRFSYRFSDCIVAVSRGVAARLRAVPGISSSNVRVVYNGAWTPTIEKLAAEPTPHPWLADSSAPVVLASGRLEAQKDFETLLHAFAVLRRKRSARLMILGEGSQRGRLERLARDLKVQDYVAFPGFVVNPWAYMARASVFALSSLHEGLANVLIEALACGTPVVSTDCPSGPEEILEGGSYGTLVPLRDSGALADAICRALDEPVPTDRLKQRARAFSVEAAAAGYLDALGFSSGER